MRILVFNEFVEEKGAGAMKRLFKTVFVLGFLLATVFFVLKPSSQTEKRSLSSTYDAAHESLYSSEVSPQEAWGYLQTSLYEIGSLPFQAVSFRDFVSAVGEDLLLKDSKRTIKSGNHFIPYQRKLIFPMGICLRGVWSIEDHPYPYTGYFKPGSKGALIARAATSLDRIYYDEHRTLALSGKIFPTTDVDDAQALPAANFLLMNDNAGVEHEYFTEAPLTNAAPTTKSFAAVPLALIGYKVGQAFNLSDKRRDMRQLYQIAELAEEPPYVSPKWMVLRGSEKYQKISRKLKAQDYRHELINIIDLHRKAEFEVFTADELKGNNPIYTRIGRVVFNEYAASKECDQSLHFQHPPYLEKYDIQAIDQEPYENETLY